MPDNHPCQLSRKHHRVFGIIFSHFPFPPRRSPLPFFFRFLKCQTHRFSQPVRPIFPSLPSPSRQQAAFSSFFRFLKCQMHRFSQSVRPIFPSPSSPPRRQAAFSSFFRFFKCQMHRFSQSVRPIFPSLSSPPRRQAAILVKIDVPPQTDENFAFPYEKLFFSGKNQKKHF